MRRTPDNDLDKRAHYRVDDDVEFNYFIIPDDEAPNTHNHEAAMEHLFNAESLKHFHLMRAIRQIDEESHDYLSSLTQRDPKLSAYLKTINRKFSLVLNELFLGDTIEKVKVNLSLGGVAFYTDESIKEDTWLLMKVILKPSYDVLVCQGRVRRVCEVETDMGKKNQVSVEFENLNDLDEKLLSRHIMYRQTEMLRLR